ncbi:MAG: right-handed parallel beta-helix repeat-containing protein, partial [Candidatus Nanoarchaeia archaeon]
MDNLGYEKYKVKIIFLLIVLIGLIFIFSISSTSAAIYNAANNVVYECGNITEANVVYTMNQSITTTDTCIRVKADNVTLDMNGYNITGDESNDGVYCSAFNNLIVKNGVLNNFNYGLYYNGTGADFYEVNFSSNVFAIYFSSTTDSSLRNITVNENYYGIYLYSSYGNNLIDIDVEDNLYEGIYLDSSNNNNLTNIQASNNLGYSSSSAIYLSLSNNNELTNIQSSNNLGGGIALAGSANNILEDVIANSNNYGIGMSEYQSGGSTDYSFNNTLTNITANSNNDDGISLSTSSNNTLTNITANSNNDDGMVLAVESDNNILTNIIATLNVGKGVLISASSDNHLENVTTNLNKQDGIKISIGSGFSTGLGEKISPSLNNTIIDAIVNSNKNYGISIFGSSYNKISNSSIWNCSSGDYSCIIVSEGTYGGLDKKSENNSIDKTSVNYSVGHLIWINQSSNNSFNSLTLDNSNKNAVFMEGDSSLNRFYNLSISDIIQTGINITVSGGNSNKLINNSFSNVSVLDYYLQAGSVSEYELYENSLEIHALYGNIRFLNNINASGSNLSNVLTIEQNNVFVNSSQDTGLNKSANITLNGLWSENLIGVEVDWNDDGIYENCPADVCTIIGDFSPGSPFVFNVTHFTAYKTNASTGNNLTICGELWEEDAIYVLQKDITGVSGTCFTVTADNVTLDMNGYNLTGDGTGFGILVEAYDRLTIKNGEIYNFSDGIHIHGFPDRSYNFNFTNITSSFNTRDGIFLSYIYNSNFNDIITNSNERHGISLFSSDNTLTNITANSNNYTGIYLFGADNNILQNINFWDCLSEEYACLQIGNSDNNTIESGIINKSSNYLIYFYGYSSSGNNISSLVLENASNHAIFIARSTTWFDEEMTNNRFYNLSFSDISKSGIKITTGVGAKLINNTFSNIGGAEYDLSEGVASEYEIQNSDLEIYDSDYGNIMFSNISLSLTNNNLSELVEIDNNKIFVNSTQEPAFNTSANIIIYWTDYDVSKVQVDWNDDGSFEDCPEEVCQNFTASGGMYEFDVTHFTTYKISGY